ncbi:hypothetical protein, partial [Dolichospermum sp. UHCC 0259]|uniref:hypothetical protein n=1 Tax=Dolichospermum sp. UHCC 0259 TaxID=2590010 RepID=UPI001C2DB385
PTSTYPINSRKWGESEKLQEIIAILKKATEFNILAQDDMVYSFAHQSYQETLAGDYFNTLFP